MKERGMLATDLVWGAKMGSFKGTGATVAEEIRLMDIAMDVGFGESTHADLEREALRVADCIRERYLETLTPNGAD